MTLKKEMIIDEALQLLNEDGLEGVTLRKLAKRLDVYASALYWHFKNKEALVNDMAEAILDKEFSQVQLIRKNETWQNWLKEIFKKLRSSLLLYKDGGRIVASAHMSLTLAKISEESIKALIDSGVDLQQSRLIVITSTRYTFGFVIEEQMVPSSGLIKDFDSEKFKENHPLTTEAVESYFSSGKTIDALFNDGLDIIIGG